MLAYAKYGAEGFYFLPNNTEIGQVQFNNFEGIAMQDIAYNKGAVSFAPFVMADGIPRSVINISAFYPHESSPDARYIYLEVPKFNNSVTFYMNIYIPSISGDPEVGTPEARKNLVDSNKLAIIFSSVVAGSLLCCCASITIIIRYCKR